MSKLEKLCLKLGINPEREVSKLYRNEFGPEDKNLFENFQSQLNRRKKLIDLLNDKKFLCQDLSEVNAVEIGAGICSTGGALAEKCNTVISLELEKVHCLYGKRCREFFNIENLGIFHGSMTKIDGNEVYEIKEDSIDLVISHMGMFRYTIIETLEKVSGILKADGKFICVYPRFWTDSDNLNEIDRELLKRALLKNPSWDTFKGEFESKLVELGLRIEYNNILDGYNVIPMGGDVILGSNIASSREEYSQNPIEGMAFGRTLITCNTLVCKL